MRPLPAAMASCARLAREGRPLAPLDLQIAAHALALGATLVTSDRAMHHISGLRIEDWRA